MAYKGYTKYITTAEADEDIFGQIETALSLTKIIAKKLTLVSSASFTYDVSGLGVFSDPYLDSIDSMYKVSFDTDDLLIGSCVIHENGVTIWVGIEF